MLNTNIHIICGMHIQMHNIPIQKNLRAFNRHQLFRTRIYIILLCDVFKTITVLWSFCHAFTEDFIMEKKIIIIKKQD